MRNVMYIRILFRNILVLLLFAFLTSGFAKSPVTADLESSADKIFTESLKMFSNGDFWECSRNLILVLDTYPDYSEIDHVIYTLGECLYESDMLEGSRRMFEFLLAKHPTSAHLPLALSGIQRIHFEMGNYKESLKTYSLVLGSGSDPELMDYANYYAGLTYYHDKQYSNAIETLGHVRENYPYSDFAQYTRALAMLKAEKVRDAIDILQNICKLAVYTPERQKIVNESHLTLGFLYYEMGYYHHALKEFNKVSSEYENYASVLLSAGWAATKMENYKEAIIYLTDFISNYQESQDTPQGLFLLGRCYLKLGLYEEALKSYDYLIEILPAQNNMPEAIAKIQAYLHSQQEEIEKIKMDILLLESKFADMSLNLSGDVPEYIRAEKDRAQSERYILLERIRSEREILNQLNEKIAMVQLLAMTKDEQREWRAYAEYGKSRALYLYKQKEIQ